MEEQAQNTHQEDAEAAAAAFSAASDICQQLLDRYGKSSAPQHRHLCATAAATRSIIRSESLPLNPYSYFAASIATLADASSDALDSDAITALASFLAIVLPLVPRESSFSPSKARDAVNVLVELVERRGEAVTTASARAIVKCLGVLVGFCDLEDWGSVKPGFEVLLNCSIDKRPKVRKCALESLVKVFKSFESSSVKKEASKLVFSVLEGHMPLAVKLSALRATDGPKEEVLSKPEHVEVVHMLSILKHVVPHLSAKLCPKVLSKVLRLINSHYSVLTRHIFGVIETVFETWEPETVIPEAENIIKAMASYVSSGSNNPIDTILSAAILLKSACAKLKHGEAINNLPLVFGSIAGLLTSKATASQASNILKEIIDCQLDGINLFTLEKPFDGALDQGIESTVLKSTCTVLNNLLDSGSPSEHVLAVISVLFTKLGAMSYFYMRGILLKLAAATLTCQDKSEAKHLEECIGSAVIAIGPEKMLTLLPISYNTEDHSCSNMWMMPILKNYVVGSSLGFFIEHIVPLAKSFQQACSKVKKSAIREDLLAYAQGCWALLPAFCRYPTDTYQNFESLTKLLMTLLTKDSLMLENIAIALQELVYGNIKVLRSFGHTNEFATLPKAFKIDDPSTDLKQKPPYSKKMATRNIRALASCSKELLQALTNVLLDSAPEKRAYLKDAIRCLAAITDSSIRELIFTMALERCQIIKDLGIHEDSGNQMDALAHEEQGNFSLKEKDSKRCLMLELASSLVEGAGEELVALVLKLVKKTLEGSDEIGQSEAYLTLSCLLEDNSWFCASHDTELLDLLLGLKPPANIASLRRRFACFRVLLVHAIKKCLDEENTKAFLVLNEIISTIKDSTEETREAAYAILLEIDSSLRGSSSAISDGSYQKFISMIMGYLSGSSPHIRSGAVSALSILVYNNAEIGHSIIDLVPSVLALLQTKAVEVIKAVLGFVKVLVSRYQAKDMQKFLLEILNGILPWSSVSRHHFRSKVAVILEILIRKCGSATIQSLAPERYRNFLKSVLENRHGKRRSKETGSADVQQPGHPQLSSRRQKRKQFGSDIPPEGDNRTECRKRRRDMKLKGISTRRNQPNGHSDGVKFRGKPSNTGSRGNTKMKRKDFKRGPSADEFREMKRKRTGKKI